MRGHDHGSLRCNCILAPPQTCHRLLLRIELQSRLAIKRVGTATCNALLVTSEREHGKLTHISNLRAYDGEPGHDLQEPGSVR